MTTARSGTGRVPRWLYLPAAVGFAFLLLPVVSLVARADWSTVPRAITSQAAVGALWLSIQCGLAATALCLVVGVPLALVLPPVVGGVALLLVFGRRGLVGGWLNDTFGVSLPFTTAGVVVAEAFVAMPFLVISVEGALRGADARYEEAAATLGANRWTAFRRVTLPLVAPGTAAGAVLCWARALGEFGATITFAGNFPGRTQTMPLAVYLALEQDVDAAIVLSLVLLVVSVVILGALRNRWLGNRDGAA
jgi:molybdate transport system permease protein